MPKEGIELCDEDKNKCMEQFRKLLSENEKLTIFQDHEHNYLQRFLYCTDFDVENAINKMEMFYNVLDKHPKWYTTKHPTEKKNIIEKDIRILTNIHDKEGRPVYIIKLGNVNANTMDLVDDVIPVDDFLLELLLMTDPKYKNGICVVVDILHFPWNVLKWLTPGNMKTSVSRMLTMPIKEFKFHVVNSSRIIKIAVNLTWPFLPQHVKDNIIFHYEDWDGLHKYIDKHLLPTEYRGDNNMNNINLCEQLYERDEEIASSFRRTRQLYLNHIKKISC